MPARKFPRIIRWLLLIGMAALLIKAGYMGYEYYKYKHRLARLRLITAEGDSLVVKNGLTAPDDSLFFNPEVMNDAINLHTPFADTTGFATLCKSPYIRNPQYDLFGKKRSADDFYYFNPGMDIQMPLGTAVYPLASLGVVSEVYDDPNHLEKVAGYNKATGQPRPVQIPYGRTVKVVLPEGITVVYARLANVHVQPGQLVKRSTILGTVGNSGALPANTPTHLHFELRNSQGLPFDPVTRVQYRQADFRAFSRHISTK